MNWKNLRRTAALAPLAMLLMSGQSSTQTNGADLALGFSVINDCINECGLPDFASEEAAMTWMRERFGLINDGAGGASPGAGGSPGGANGPKGIGLGLGLGLNATQVVYLDFQPGDPTWRFVIPAAGIDISGDDYFYTDEDKAIVKARLEADYAPYNIEFVLEEPTEGDFVTLQFNSNDAPGAGTAGVLPNGGILFGSAGEIDFGNDNRSIIAINDATVWPFFNLLDASQGLTPGTRIEAFTGIDVIGVGFITDGLEAVTLEEATRTAVLNQTANTGAHELGHGLGLRHYDAWGPIGGGLPSSGRPAPGSFAPIYTGPQAAVETSFHLMASGASSGISLADSANSDRFHSERSAIKLAINERGRFVTDDQANTGQASLKKLQVVNPILEGENADGRIDVRNIVIEGRLDALDEVDTFTFSGQAGQVFNAEMISDVEGFFFDDWDRVLGRLQLFLENGDGTRTFVALNDAEFESLDAFMLDVVLPETGTYTLEMSAPNEICLAACGTATPFVLPLSLFGFTDEVEFRTGQYITNAYIVESKNGKGPKKIGGPKK